MVVSQGWEKWVRGFGTTLGRSTVGLRHPSGGGMVIATPPEGTFRLAIKDLRALAPSHFNPYKRAITHAD